MVVVVVACVCLTHLAGELRLWGQNDAAAAAADDVRLSDGDRAIGVVVLLRRRRRRCRLMMDVMVAGACRKEMHRIRW